MTEEKYITLNELFKSGRIYWLKSFQTLRKWILRDIKCKNILETRMITNSEGLKTGTRYFIPERNIDNFIQAFKENKLYD